MRLDRRDVTKAGVLALLGAFVRNSVGSLAMPHPYRGLASLGADCGMKVGIQASVGRFTQPKLGPFLQDNFNMITPPLKWEHLRPTADRYEFAQADNEIAYATTHGLAVHGHNLCWNDSNPSWLGAVLTPQNARSYLASYIHTVVGRYRGKIDSWDVVNEPIWLWSKNPECLRTGTWLDLIGPEYIDLAFHTTRDADPSCLRTLNVNVCEEQSTNGDRVRTATLDLVKTLLKRGVPVQAVALESHVAGPWKPGYMAFLDFLRALRDTGVEIYISELDVNDTSIAGSSAQVESAVAETYCNYLKDVLSVASIKRVIFWSASDQFDWYSTLQQYRRPDNKGHHLGLTDVNFTPNPSYYSVREVLLASACRDRRVGD